MKTNPCFDLKKDKLNFEHTEISQNKSWIIG